ncbi:MAG: diguanylate cyclase [Candidatus Eremiobacteraeota bacterium]|nr:diguanylate cyclase [Candidatus Eremiobacteraeota bacterium]
MNDVPVANIRNRQSRLEALWDLALAENATPDAQLRLVLEDSLDALGADYAEFGYGQGDGYALAASVMRQKAEAAVPLAIGRVVGAADGRAVMIFDTHGEEEDRFPFRSVLSWPFYAQGKRSALGFGWNVVRESFISEEEIRYIEFLSRVISRLLDMALESQELSAKIATDTLTGLRNRAATMEQMDASISAARRSGAKAAVLYIDLDGFKAVNDTHGHAFGDLVLAEAGTRMRDAVRKHEVAGRIGGDEFAVLIPTFNDEAELYEVARRIHNSLHEPIALRGARTQLDCSIGIAIFPDDAHDANELLHRADEAMYEAKRSRGQIMFATRKGAVERVAPAPHEAGPRFILCYQPIVDARTGKAIAIEALIRFIGDEGSLSRPGPYLEAAFRSGSSLAVDRDVLRAMSRRLPGTRRNGTEIIVHVNVQAPNDELLAIEGDLSGLAFEVREENVAAAFAPYQQFFAACRKRRIRTGLSNFGCGGLSLRDLGLLEVDFVKIGPELLGSETIMRTGAAARAAIDTAHRFGWLVVAENVETEMLREWFVANGADALQGFAICSPLTGADIDDWLCFNNGM